MNDKTNLYMICFSKKYFLRNKIILFGLILILRPVFIKSQTVDMGGPLSWHYNFDENALPVRTMPQFDLNQQRAEDLINDEMKIGPWRFGYEHDVSINVLTASISNDIPGRGKVYRLGLNSPGALTMNLIFSDFYLPTGAILYIYNSDRSEMIGAYTASNNRPERGLGTELLSGDKIIVDYFEPQEAEGLGSLTIGVVVHGYRGMHNFAAIIARDLNDSGDCNHDVLCPSGIGWEDQISAIAMLINFGAFCSGVLINNTANNQTPYLLTANHCGTSGTEFWVARFNWDSTVPVCASASPNSDPGPPYDESANGATLRANNALSDFNLVTFDGVTSEIAADWGLCFAGWDRSDLSPTQSTGIHHPWGDVKKICRDFDVAAMEFISGVHTWRIDDWDIGVTEPGSSGSPLFDQNGRIIGQLFGGFAACNGTDDNNLQDYYGRFAVSWTGGGTPQSRLSDWLDPIDSGALVLDGLKAAEPIPALSEWGLILLLLSLAVIGTVAIKKFHCSRILLK